MFSWKRLWDYLIELFVGKKVIENPWGMTGDDVSSTFSILVDIQDRIDNEICYRLSGHYGHYTVFEEKEITNITYPVEIVGDTYLTNLSDEQLAMMMNLINSICDDYRDRLKELQLI